MEPSSFQLADNESDSAGLNMDDDSQLADEEPRLPQGSHLGTSAAEGHRDSRRKGQQNRRRATPDSKGDYSCLFF